jgi:hypothetical protein
MAFPTPARVHGVHAAQQEKNVMTSTAKGSNRGRIFVNDGFVDHEFQPLPRNRWLDIESAVKVNLSADARSQLMEVTREYASTLRPKTSLNATKTILDSIDQWRRQTDILRRKIWNSPAAATAQARASDSIRDIVIAYTEAQRSQIERKYILAELDRFLSSAVEIARFAQRTIDSNRYNAKPDSHLWFAWAAAVSLILAKSGVRRRHPLRKQLSPGYVKALGILQESLPPSLQRRKGDALRKGAVTVFKIAQKKDSVKLPRMLLKKWGKGNVSYDPENNPHFWMNNKFYTRFLKEVEISTSGGSKPRRSLDT